MVLENKLGIENQIELNKTGEKLANKKAKQLFDTGETNNILVDTFEGLCKIHAVLFDKIYDFAGKMRNVNISKR